MLNKLLSIFAVTACFQMGLSIGEASTCKFKYEHPQYGKVEIKMSHPDRSELINQIADECFRLLRNQNLRAPAEDVILECANQVPEQC